MFIRNKKITVVVIFFLLCLGSFIFLLKFYKPRPWIPNYVAHLLTRKKNLNHPTTSKHIIFLYVDHFEPQWQGANFERQKKRINTWLKRYPKMAEKHLDSDGRHPQHTWFYMVDDWMNRVQNYWNLREISKLCYEGFGEIELHVHHGPQGDIFGNVSDSQALYELIDKLKYFFSLTGALITAEKDPRRIYGFIHGMWALDNSIEKFCGVNDELTVLQMTGCYCDFTMPSGPVTPTQSKKINRIYYAKDDPDWPKSYDMGVDVSVSNAPREGLMIFSGPFHVNFDFSDITVDTGELDTDSKLSKYTIEKRVDDWVKANIHVRGQPNWVFVKICTHGCMEENFHFNFGSTAHRMFSYLEKKYNDGEKFQLHYVTAREAYNIVKAAEAGESRNPDKYRDYIIKPYANTKISSNRPYQLKTYNSCELGLHIRENTENVNLRFKDLLMKEIKSSELQSLRYTLDLSEKQILIHLLGKGETDIHLTIPKVDVSEKIYVSKGTLVKKEDKNKTIDCYVRTSLTGSQTKKIEIRF